MTETAPADRARAWRILVAEDHPAMGRFITAVLAAAGWTVVGPFGDCGAALAAARQQLYDLAMIDRTLRGEDALAVAEAVSERGLPCLLVSGYPRASLPERFRDYPFLEKPFAKEALVEAVRYALLRSDRAD
jgi:DNA-binding response OmpR family regulator